MHVPARQELAARGVGPLVARDVVGPRLTVLCLHIHACATPGYIGRIVSNCAGLCVLELRFARWVLDLKQDVASLARLHHLRKLILDLRDE